MSPAFLGACIGLMLAVGMVTTGSRLLATRRPRLIERVAPYVPLPADRRAALAPAGSLWHVVRALIRPMRRSTTVATRLRRAGIGSDATRYRLDQAAWIGVGLAAGVLLSMLAVARGASPLAVLILPVFGGGIGALLADRWLTARTRQRSRRMSQQLPNIADLLAFAVAAGESPIAGLDRVAKLVAGELADEIDGAIRAVHAGEPLADALRGVSDATGSPDVERFTDGLIIAMERGTPLVDVLRAQAADARAASRRALIEVAGRKDVLMLVPVVFLILPTVVLVAVYPGFTSLQLFIP